MARPLRADWRTDHQLWIESFALINFAGLAADIYLAHSANAFRRTAEYIPLYFSAAAPIVLLAGVALRRRAPSPQDAGQQRDRSRRRKIQRQVLRRPAERVL